MREDNDLQQVSPMQPNEIRAELLRKNITVTSISSDLGVAQSSVSQVINWDKPWRKETPRIQEYIASKIDRSVDEVFPG